MRFAELDDYDEIVNLFSFYKDYFPHVRKDSIKERIENKECVFDDGVVITFKVHQKSVQIGNKIRTQKSDCVIRQILSKNHKGSGTRILNQFFDYVSSSSSFSGAIYLTVRSDNDGARKFYEKNGMEVVDSTSWSDGKLDGVVYRKIISANSITKFL